MNYSSSADSLQRLLFFPFEDKDWKRKLGIASLIALFSIGIPLILPIIFLLGYCEKIMSRIIREKGEPYLPEWEDWSDLLTRGVRLFCVSLIFAVPVVILFVLAYVVMMAGSLKYSNPNMYTQTNILEPVIASLLSSAGGMIIFFAATLIGMVGGAVLPAGACHVVATGQFMAFFHVGEWWQIFQANLKGFIAAYAFSFGVIWVTSICAQLCYMSMICCCLTPFIASIAYAYDMVIDCAIFAEAYRVGSEKVGLVRELAGKLTDDSEE